MKKRISIVTWLGDGNYGTALQAFALKHKLELLGCEAQLLYKIGVVRSIRETVGKIFGKKKSLSRSEKVMEEFWRKYGNVRNVYSILPKYRLRRETDLFLNGSDQVWNTYFYFDPFYFIAFAGNDRRAAYASSIGTDSVNPKYRGRVSFYLSKFSHIGVREESGVKALTNLTGRKDIRQVVDPTFLLSSDDWKNFLNDTNPEQSIEGGYMLVYLIGKNEEYQSQVDEIAQRSGLKQIVVIESKESGDFVKGTKNIKDQNPLEFVRLIEGASLVCTDSFHATALSMNMNRDFVVLKRFKDSDKASQNSRLYDLLERYDVKDRLYNPSSALNKIDYNRLNERLSKDIADSEEFLIREIENR